MKIIDIPHKACPINCAWNGMEDQYEQKMGERPIQYLFFSLSGIGNSIFSEFKNMHISHYNNLFTISMYKFMENIAGYGIKAEEKADFGSSIDSIKNYIDSNIPVIIGALDMYNLKYFDWAYHKIHIPIHYLTAVGYDDESGEMIVYDNDRENPQRVKYDELKSTFETNVPFLLFTANFHNINSIRDIVYTGFKKKADLNLSTSLGYSGTDGIRRFGEDLIKWKKQMDADDYKKILLHFVEYTGFPPLLPKELLPYKPVNDSVHMAGRDVLSNVLKTAGEKYNQNSFSKGAILFTESGRIIQDITNEITGFLLGKTDMTDSVKEKFLKAAQKEEEAYRLLLNI